ncbi:MAG: nitroreductase/quinone reductase family protein [Anaerolineales bacterium]
MAANYGLMRKAFRVMNAAFMVPIYRLGLEPILGSPVGGYIMVIKTTGRLTGKTRYTPVNYAIANGSIYCTAGFGKASHWVRNLSADPNVELLLPAGAVTCQAEVVEDTQEKFRMLRQVLINSGFAAFVFGRINPFRVTTEKLNELTKEYIMLRFRPIGIGSGPADQGSWLWIWPTAAIIALIWWLRR